MKQPKAIHINQATPAHINYITAAVPLNNLALKLFNQGDFAGAEQKHLEALALKEHDFGLHDYRVAITLNALGETQLRLNKLDEAEANLRRAVAIRDEDDVHGLDAAVSRENLAQVLEAKHNLPEAKALRMRGEPSICCGNYTCPGGVFKAADLKTCSLCKSVFYCSNTCQKRDWKTRHKTLCNRST